MDKGVACKKILRCSDKGVVVDLARCLDTFKCSCFNKTIFLCYMY